MSIFTDAYTVGADTVLTTYNSNYTQCMSSNVPSCLHASNDVRQTVLDSNINLFSYPGTGVTAAQRSTVSMYLSFGENPYGFVAVRFAATGGGVGYTLRMDGTGAFISSWVGGIETTLKTLTNNIVSAVVTTCYLEAIGSVGAVVLNAKIGANAVETFTDTGIGGIASGSPGWGLRGSGDTGRVRIDNFAIDEEGGGGGSVKIPMQLFYRKVA